MMTYETERRRIMVHYQERKQDLKAAYLEDVDDLDLQNQRDLAILDLRYNGLAYTDRHADVLATIEALGITPPEAIQLVNEWWQTGKPN